MPGWREIDVTIIINAAISAIRKRTVMNLGIIAIILLAMILPSSGASVRKVCACLTGSSVVCRCSAKKKGRKERNEETMSIRGQRNEVRYCLVPIGEVKTF